MLRGCQKKIIYIKDSKSRFFDEVYFVLKNNASVVNTDKADMLREAGRIIDENLLGICASKNQSGKSPAEKHFSPASACRSTLLFLAGASASGLVCVSAMLILYFL